MLEPLAAETGARAVAVDLTDAAAVERLAADHADVDVLVANAGLPGCGHILSFSVEEIDRALAVNLRAPMILARLIGERMVQRGARPHRARVVAVGQGGDAADVGLQRDEVRPARLRDALRQDLRPPASA